ncbi:MAG: glycosyltransferase family 9 protein [Myxococcales bacterium]|nr:glycosyltransferase family 9 protein [Myxococcales bacterium]
MRILLFHKGGIGDVVFGLPLIRDLKAAHPGASLTVLTHRQGAELLALSPQVDQTVSYGPLAGGWSLGSARRAIGTERFDLALTTARSPRAAYLLWRTGAKVRVGFGGGPESLLYTHRAPASPFEVVFSRRFQRLARALGVPTDDAMPRLMVPSGLLEDARRQLQSMGWRGGPLVAVHVGGGWPTKQWPLRHLLELCRVLRERGATALLQGGADDRARAEAVAKESGAMVCVGNSIAEAVAQASLCRAAVGLDSGLSHAAAAAGVPTVFLFGPNDERSILLGPEQKLLTATLRCRPCNRAGRARCPEGHHRCMGEIEPGRVLETVQRGVGG